MGLEVVNKNRNCVFNGPYAGRDLHITMYQDNEREFLVTHNAKIKPVVYFTGREMELLELRQRIEAGRKSVLVSGMGGIGKTHICRKLFEEYMNKHAENESEPFRYIGYIEYNGNMDSSLQNCLKFKQQNSPEQNQQAAWRELEYLAADGKLLLFVDNVDKPISADPGLRKLKEIPGAIVLTSRQVSFGDEFEPYRIGFLDMGQCLEIYEKIRFEASGKKIDSGEREDLEYIIENLAARHTITIERLAYMARKKHWTVKILREKLEQKGFRLTFHKNGELVNIQESYEKLYDLSELTEAEQNILEAFSVFPYIPLAAETCNEWLLADAGISEDDDILMGLYEKGWLQFDVEQESYTMHPVFAKFIHEKTKPRAEMHLWLIEVCQKCIEIPKNGLALERRQFVPFAEGILEKVDMGKTKLQADFLYRYGIILWHIADHKKAKKALEECVKIYLDVLGEEHSDTANGYEALAREYVIENEYAKAEKLYKRCLQMKEKLLGEEHLDTAAAYSNLAEFYKNRGKHKEAEDLYKKSLLVREKLLGEEHPDTIINYENLGEVYQSQQKYKEAEKLYKKSLQIREKMTDPLNLSWVLCYRRRLALMYTAQARYSEAEEMYMKCLQTMYLNNGAIEYQGLSLIYERQGEYEKLLTCDLMYCKTLSLFFGVSLSSESAMYKRMEEAFTKCKYKGNFKQWLEEQMQAAD